MRMQKIYRFAKVEGLELVSLGKNSSTGVKTFIFFKIQ